MEVWGTFAVLIAELTLLFAPIGAAIATASVRDKPAAARRLWIGSSIYLGVFAAAWVLGVETVSAPVNFVLSAGVYWFFSLAAVLCLTLTFRPARLVMGGLGLVSFLPGYVLATVGLLGLVFIVGDYAGPPRRAVVLRPGLSCRVMNWGAAFSDDGYDVHLYRYWPWMPLLRRQVAKITVDETEPVKGLASASCEGVARAWDQGRL